MNHIVFVYPPGTSTSKIHISSHFQMCLGSAYIIAYLIQNGFTAQQFLAQEPVNVSECVKQILSKKPKIIGFTVYVSNYCLCQLIAGALKQADPNIIILFGGPTASVQPEIILKNNRFVDICVRNEGEETCLELLSRLDEVNFDLKKAAESLEKISGISYSIGDKILNNPGRDILLENRKVTNFLDKYPSPCLSGIVKTSKLGIITARGCNRHCVYCNCAVVSKRIIATHSTDRVIEELDYISKNIAQDYALDIFDDAFTLLPDRALEICSKIIENQIKLRLTAATRCDCINEELLDKMKEAGFKAIGFSLESAVPHILRRIGKVQHPETRSDSNFEKEKEFIEKFIKYVTYAKKIGIETVYASIMVGLPTETLEEGRQTVELIRSLGKNLDYYAHNFFQVYPGTPIFSNYKKYGIRLFIYNDQVHYKTIHTYNTSRIKVAPNSNLELDTISQDKVNMKTMALLLSKWGRHPQPIIASEVVETMGKKKFAEKTKFRKELIKNTKFNYFNKIILCADIITGELILWLQKYLALNGSLIQIYSDFDRAKQHSVDNEDALIQYRSPTHYHASYYKSSGEDEVISLTPFRTYQFGKQCGVKIDLVNTNQGLSSSNNAKMNPLQSICIDRAEKKEDALQLHHLLADLTNKKNSLSHLLDRSFYPYFSSICRWEKTLPNCRSLEIVIVDSDNNVKTCWNGKSIGKIGMPLPEIKENLRNMHRTVENRRGCNSCNKKAACSRCLFPDPLSENKYEYCFFKRNFNIEESAELIRTFDLFKELKN